MNNRKLRFNAIDILILLFLAAAVAVILYVFVFGVEKNEIPENTRKDIHYVIEINNLDENLSDAVKTGQAVQDAIERKSIGIVSGVEAIPYRKISFDAVNGRETVSEVADRITLRITIEASAEETDRAFTVDGCEIRVGELYSLMLPNMYCVGYCIELSADQIN